MVGHYWVFEPYLLFKLDKREASGKVEQSGRGDGGWEEVITGGEREWLLRCKEDKNRRGVVECKLVNALTFISVPWDPKAYSSGRHTHTPEAVTHSRDFQQTLAHHGGERSALNGTFWIVHVIKSEWTDNRITTRWTAGPKMSRWKATRRGVWNVSVRRDTVCPGVQSAERPLTFN